MARIPYRRKEQTNLEDFGTMPDRNPPQDWVAYNASQTREKALFVEMLKELVSIIPEKPDTNRGKGRPPMNLKEMVFCCVLKTYLTFSSRRSISDLKITNKAKYIDSTPHFNTIIKYLNKPDVEPVLKELIMASSIPLAQVEENYTVDSTGFSTSNFERWLSIRTAKPSKYRLYKKAHVMSGTKTNIITHIEVTPGYTGDSNIFPFLVSKTAEFHNIKEISADMAYSSRKNLTIAKLYGAVPYIPFKKHSTGRSGGCYIWKKMFNYFTEHYDEFMHHYHLRSNAESTFSMIKRKFGNAVRSRKEQAQKNEILCKVLCHNICCLIAEIFELGIEVDFNKCAEIMAAHKKD